MKGLRTILGDSVKNAGGPRRADEVGCMELWERIVGESIADATRVERLRDGILFVTTRSSVWSYELTFVKEEIIRTLNERMGRPLVRDIRFKTGPLTLPAVPAQPGVPEGPSAPAENGAAPAPEMPAITEEMLTERSRARVEEAVAAIKDEQIRTRMRGVLVREAHRREQKQQQGWRECRRCGTLHPEGHKLCPLCRLHIKT